MPNQASQDILFWLVIIVIAAVVMIVVGLVVRRIVLHEDDHGDTEAFTLGDLRQLHQEGHMSDEELQRAKAGLIARGLAQFGDTEQDDDAADKPANHSDNDLPHDP